MRARAEAEHARSGAAVAATGMPYGQIPRSVGDTSVLGSGRSVLSGPGGSA